MTSLERSEEEISSASAMKDLESMKELGDLDASDHPISSILPKRDSAETHDLSWSNVNMIVSEKKGDATKHVLKDVWGIAKAGETTAIMGPR